MATLKTVFDLAFVDGVNAGVKGTPLTKHSRQDAAKRWNVTERAIEFFFASSGPTLRLMPLATVEKTLKEVYEGISAPVAERTIMGMLTTGKLEMTPVTSGDESSFRETQPGFASLAHWAIELLQGDIDKLYANCIFEINFIRNPNDWSCICKYNRPFDSDEYFAALAEVAPWWRDGEINEE